MVWAMSVTMTIKVAGDQLMMLMMTTIIVLQKTVDSWEIDLASDRIPAVRHIDMVKGMKHFPKAMPMSAEGLAYHETALASNGFAQQVPRSYRTNKRSFSGPDFTNTNICICISFCICMCICVYVYVYVHICMYICMYVRMYVCLYVCMYVCMYIYIYIHT